MICRLHNHQKNLGLKYKGKMETTFVNGEDSLFSVLRRNGIRLISTLIRGRLYILKLRFPDGSLVVFESDKLQSSELITRILSKLNEICTTNRHPVYQSNGFYHAETSTGMPVFLLNNTHRDER